MKKLVLSLFLCAMASFGTVPASAGIAEHVNRSKVGGVDVIVYPTGVKNVVTLVGFLPAGNAFSAQGNLAIASLTGMMLDRGTVKRDQFAIAQQLESAGVNLDFSVDNQTVTINGRLRKQNIPMIVGILAEELRTPAFNAAEFDKARLQFIGERQAEAQDVTFRAGEAFAGAVYPVGHPNRMPPHEELIAAAGRATLDEVKAFHRAHYGLGSLTLIFVGDVNAAEIRREVAKSFGGWKGGSVPLDSSAATMIAGPQDVVVAVKDKASVTMMLGQRTGLRYKDPDTLALRVGSSILGSGVTSRLMSSVREQEGLTYGIVTRIWDDSFTDGGWAIYGTFAPALLDKGVASTRRELHKWWSEGVTPAELAARKKNLIGSYQVGLATTEGIASAILNAVQRGYDLTWLDEYSKAIDALTVEQVNAAIKKYLAPDKMVLIKAGSVS